MRFVLFSWNINKLWRVFSSFVKFGHFSLLWRLLKTNIAFWRKNLHSGFHYVVLEILVKIPQLFQNKHCVLTEKFIIPDFVKLPLKLSSKYRGYVLISKYKLHFDGKNIITDILNLISKFSSKYRVDVLNSKYTLHFDGKIIIPDFMIFSCFTDMIPRSKSPLWAFIAILAICIPSVYSLAVMSVDLGTEWMKVAVVSVSNFECCTVDTV